MNLKQNVQFLLVGGLIITVTLSAKTQVSQNTNSTNDSYAITEKYGGTEFIIPPGWKPEKIAGGLLLWSPEIEAGWQANIFVELRVDKESRSLTQGMEDEVPNLQKQKHQFHEISRKVTKNSNGLDYALLEYVCDNEGTSLTEWEVVFKLQDGKRLFVLTSSASSKLDKYGPVFKSFLESLH